MEPNGNKAYSTGCHASFYVLKLYFLNNFQADHEIIKDLSRSFEVGGP